MHVLQAECNTHQLTISATLSPMTSLSKGEPKHDDIPIPGSPARATAVSATQSPTELPIANTVSPRMPEGGEEGGGGGGGEREHMIYRDLISMLKNRLPVSIPKQRPNVSSTATTSLASMFSQAMDMMKASVPRTICMLQCGGLFTFSRKNKATDDKVPAVVCVCVCVCVCVQREFK